MKTDREPDEFDPTVGRRISSQSLLTTDLQDSQDFQNIHDIRSPTAPTKSLIFIFALAGGTAAFAINTALVPRVSEQLVAVWSTRSFITADLGGGTTTAHGNGFTLFDSDGDLVYGDSALTNYIPCWGGELEFTLEGGCFVNAKCKFYCKVDPFTGTPEVCQSRDEFDNILAAGEGDDDVVFFAVGSGSSGHCATVFTVAEGINCQVDGGLSATEHNDSPP